MSGRFLHWLDGEEELLEHLSDGAETPDASRKERKHLVSGLKDEVDHSARGQKVIRMERTMFYRFYAVTAVLSCLCLLGVLLFVVAYLPGFGAENPRTLPVVERYVTRGLEETGAVNIVSGMILDYRAFDTLGESHVLFTALICVMILLRVDRKNMRTEYEDYHLIREERYHEISGDSILHRVGMILIPCVALYGIYVLLNGQNSPGGGFSGGAVMGAGMIIYASAFGFRKADRLITARLSSVLTFAALGFYSFAKGYVFFTGANGLENHIPKGTPGAIFSGGLILPLDIAVGLVVAFTMYGFYSLFRRGNIGGGQ